MELDESLPNHLRASGFSAWCCDWPRQIWPPSRGLLSSTPTRAPLSAAEQAAAIPAGPAPMTRTSKLRGSLFISANVHSRNTQNLTSARMAPMVHGSATLEANAHAAERSAGLSRDGTANRRGSGGKNCRESRCAGRNRDTVPVHRHGKRVRHEHSRKRGPADREPRKFPACGAATDPQRAALCQAKWLCLSLRVR